MKEEWKITIRIAGNTRAPCLSVLLCKGYQIQWFYQENSNGSYDGFLEAYKNNNRICADSPEELLGLVYMWEQRGNSWKNLTSDESDLLQKLEDDAIILNEQGEEIND